MIINEALLSLSSFRKCGEENTIEYGVFPQSNARLTKEKIDKLVPVEGTLYFTNGEKFFYHLEEKDRWFIVEPLRWKAVRKDGEYFLFTTEKLVDARLYEKGDEKPLSHDDHNVKTYLNKEFFPKAFLDGGKLLMESPDFHTKICFLTTNQIHIDKGSLLFHNVDDLLCNLTDFARVKGGKDVGNEKDGYYIVNSQDYIFHIVLGTFIIYYEKDPYNPHSGYSGNYAIRPTIWLKLG